MAREYGFVILNLKIAAGIEDRFSSFFINEKDALLDPSVSFEIASGRNPLLFQQMCKSDLDLQHVFMSIALSIVWATLDVEELIDILHARILPLDIFFGWVATVHA